MRVTESNLPHLRQANFANSPTRKLLLSIAAFAIASMGSFFAGYRAGLATIAEMTSKSPAMSRAQSEEFLKPENELKEDSRHVDNIAWGLSRGPKHWPSVMRLFLENIVEHDDGIMGALNTDGVDRSLCRCCGSKMNLSVHHIQRCEPGEPLWFDVKNLVTLCGRCLYNHGHRNPETGNIGWNERNEQICEECPSRFRTEPDGATVLQFR